MELNVKLDDLPESQMIQSWVDALDTLKALINDYKIPVKKEDRSKYRVVGTKTQGFMEEALYVAELHRNKLPGDIDIAKVRQLHAIYRAFSPFFISLRQSFEQLDDLDLAIRHLLRLQIDDLYNCLKDANNRDASMDNVMRPLYAQYKRSRKAKEPTTTTSPNVVDHSHENPTPPTPPADSSSTNNDDTVA